MSALGGVAMEYVDPLRAPAASKFCAVGVEVALVSQMIENAPFASACALSHAVGPVAMLVTLPTV